MLRALSYATFARYRGLMVDPIDARRTLAMCEIECLRALAVGKTDIEAAKELGISPRTMRSHIDGAKAQLGVSSRVQAVARALHDRIIVA